MKIVCLIGVSIAEKKITKIIKKSREAKFFCDDFRLINAYMQIQNKQ